MQEIIVQLDQHVYRDPKAKKKIPWVPITIVSQQFLYLDAASTSSNLYHQKQDRPQESSHFSTVVNFIL